MTWASSSHFRHPWFVSKRKRCETPVDDLAETVVSKRRRQCNTLEHGFAYLSIGNPTTMDVPWTSLANDSCSSAPIDFSAMDSDMLPPQPAYIVEEPTVPEVDMKASSWYEPEPDRIVITDLDLFTESDDEREREREESVNINPILLDCIRSKELGKKSSPHIKATSTALVLFKPLPGLEQLQREGVTQAKAVDENAMDLEP